MRINRFARFRLRYSNNHSPENKSEIPLPGQIIPIYLDTSDPVWLEVAVACWNSSALRKHARAASWKPTSMKPSPMTPPNSFIRVWPSCWKIAVNSKSSPVSRPIRCGKPFSAWRSSIVAFMMPYSIARPCWKKRPLRSACQRRTSSKACSPTSRANNG